VDKAVLTTVLRRDEAKSLLIVEPLDCPAHNPAPVVVLASESGWSALSEPVLRGFSPATGHGLAAKK